MLQLWCYIHPFLRTGAEWWARPPWKAGVLFNFHKVKMANIKQVIFKAVSKPLELDVPICFSDWQLSAKPRFWRDEEGCTDDLRLKGLRWQKGKGEQGSCERPPTTTQTWCYPCSILKQLLKRRRTNRGCYVAKISSHVTRRTHYT